MASNDQLSFYISLPATPVHLSPWKSKADPNSTERQSESTVLAAFSALCIIQPTSKTDDSGKSCNNSDRISVYIRSCLSSQKLYRELVEVDDLSSLEFLLGASFAESGSGVERQLFAFIADDIDKTALRSQVEKRQCTTWIYEKDTTATESGLLWRLADFQTKGICNEKARQMPKVLVISEQQSEVTVSPIFAQQSLSPVFHDYERSMEVLSLCKECEEVQKLFKIAAQELAEQKNLTQLKTMMKKPLVVVEGMDATGKTTLTEFLEKKLGAARYSTPPPCLLPLRCFFDKLPEIVRRAYYSLGNYIVAQQIALECQTRAVVMDRYWHSTAAYGIANETSLDDLPPPGHQDYCWPSDLLKPSAIIFLTISENVRRQRLGNRHISAITFEERSLNKDQLFRKRLCEAYLRMQEPACVQVDASGSKEEVVDAVLKQLKLQGVLRY